MQACGQQQQLAFVVAVDTSTSMLGAPINAAIRGMKHIVGMMEPTDLFGLSTFDTNVRNLHHAMPCSKINTAKDWDNVRANNRDGGGTALWDAISEGVDELHSVHQRQQARRDRSPGAPPLAYHQIVITDGEDNSSATRRQDLCQRVAHPGVPNYHLTLVAVGVDADAARHMQQVVNAAGRHGRFIRVSNVRDLEEHLRRQAERIRLSLKLTSPGQRMSMTVETTPARARQAAQRMVAATGEADALHSLLGSMSLAGGSSNTSARSRRALAYH